mgnify:CR=1 FL=1
MSSGVAFEKARAEGRAALVGYLPAGFPTVEGSIRAFTTMVDAGCDIIEVAREQLPDEIKPEVGMQLEVLSAGGGSFPARITEVNDRTITLDANHPLAGGSGASAGAGLVRAASLPGAGGTAARTPLLANLIGETKPVAVAPGAAPGAGGAGLAPVVVAGLGWRPTFADARPDSPVLEIHLLDFEGDLYGATLEVAFLARLRDEIRFPNAEALVARVRDDIARARQLLAAGG